MSQFFKIGERDVLNRSAVNSIMYVPNRDDEMSMLYIITQDVRIIYLEKAGGTQLRDAMNVISDWLIYVSDRRCYDFAGFGRDVFRVMPEVREWQ